MSSQPDQSHHLDLSVMNSGHSLRVTIPAEVSRDADLEKGDIVWACYDRENATITYHLD